MVGSELEVYIAPGEPGPLHEPWIKNQTRTSKKVDKQTNQKQGAEAENWTFHMFQVEKNKLILRLFKGIGSHTTLSNTINLKPGLEDKARSTQF